ncbi:MAG: LysE family translocator [Boseongicola sp. SB0667_bin_21]|nr:LysE family translocator [Boseongicola sp. SB0667_bin_21]
MTSFLAVLTIVAVAAITPGPNNFIVMSASLRGGVAAALPAIAGVIAGSIALLVLVWAGAGTLFELVPEIQPVLRIAGAAYLIWLGACLVRRASGPGDGTDDQALPETAWGVASFQLLNPKSWVLVVTAVSAVGGTLAGMASLAVIFAAVMGLCLTIWAVAGQLISRWLVDRRSRRMFDTVMGVLLMGSAAMLLP